MKATRLFILTLFLSSSLPTDVFSAFQDSGWGARPVGMGGAFTAIADDSNAPVYNPAGIVQVQWNEVTGMYSRLFSGLTLNSGSQATGGDESEVDQSYVAFTARAKSYGAWGVSWANFNASSLYREDTFRLSYANYLGKIIPALDNNVSMGVNLKYLSRSFTLDSLTTDDPVFANGNSQGAFGADIGLLWKPESGACQGCRVGLALNNFNQPDVGFQEKDLVPMEWRLGGAYQSRQMPWFVPALDITHRDGDIGVHGGMESWLFNDSLGLRAGGNNDEAAMGLSYYQPLGKKAGFRFDYGFTVPFHVSDTNGSHRLQLTVYF